MKENVLNKIVITLDKDDTREQICKKLTTSLLMSQDKIYSYLIYSQYDHTTFKGWSIEYLVSQDEQYNTLNIEDCIFDIAKTVLKDKKLKEHKYVIGYKQPSLDVMCTLFEPCINKLANNVKQRWNNLEYEDLCQTCKLVMCILYKKGYYIHKHLLEKSFINYVLMSLRKERDKPALVSLNDVFSKSEGQDDITFEDKLIDYSELYEQQDKEDEEEYQQILEEERENVIDIVGQRRYDQLVREYGNNMTTGSGRMTVQKIKQKLRKDGLL